MDDAADTEAGRRSVRGCLSALAIATLGVVLAIVAANVVRGVGHEVTTHPGRADETAVCDAGQAVLDTPADASPSLMQERLLSLHRADVATRSKPLSQAGEYVLYGVSHRSQTDLSKAFGQLGDACESVRRPLIQPSR